MTQNYRDCVLRSQPAANEHECVIGFLFIERLFTSLKGFVDMSKFKKILFGGAKENMGAVAAAKLEFTRRLLFTGFVLTLACLAGFAYISKAWFASNKDVGAENASVTSASGTPNLFIRLQADKSEEKPQYFSNIQKNWSSAAPLYPISTADCKNWYYISDWAMVLSQDPKDASITRGQYYASGYAPVVDFDANNDGCYTVTTTDSEGNKKSKTYRAYYCSKYNLYSDKGELDVYLNPTEPIRITDGEGLVDAIRVGVVVKEKAEGGTEKDKLVFVYAPVKESGTGKNFIDGNSTEASANTFYAVTGERAATEKTGILVGDAGLADYKGGKVPGDPHSFTAGKKAICRAGVTGADVSVYIWLEGMDAQSVINVADNRTIGVNLNFVGVPVEVASAQENGVG